MANKIDSNLTGLRYAEETSDIGVLAGSGVVWKALEPNSYNDFGGQRTLLARAPINASRQRRKGVITDLDASAGFESDLTQDNLRDLGQGFFFADRRDQEEVDDLDSVDGSNEQFLKTDAFGDFRVNDLVFASGFGESANNGLHLVTALVTTNDGIEVDSYLDAEADPPDDAFVRVVGHQGASDDLDVDASGTNPALTSTSLDFTTLDLNVGQWVFVGGDEALAQFDNDDNNGFARILSIATNRLEFDKTENTMVNETSSGGRTVQLFFGDFLHNEDDSDNIKRRTYQFERSLSSAGFEYVEGCVPNELQIAVEPANKITWTMAFVGTNTKAVTSGNRKDGTFPDLDQADAFNTSSDFARLRLADSGDTGLATFLTQVQLTINNGVTPTKAIGTIGAVDATAGDFSVTASITALFTDVATIQAIEDNDDVTLDFAVVKDNAGIMFDLPLGALGDGRLNVTKDEPITIPLNTEGARHETLTYTMSMTFFTYLPDLAA